MACAQAGVSLAGADVKTVSTFFAAGGDSNTVDYVRMSKELQLHYSSLNFVTKRVKNVESLKEFMSKTGKSDMKHLNTDELRLMIQVY
jgi:hypothetical protein